MSSCKPSSYSRLFSRRMWRVRRTWFLHSESHQVMFVFEKWDQETKKKEKKIPFFLVYKTRVFDRRVVTLKAHLSGVSVDLRSYVAGNFWETNKESRRFWLIAYSHINQLESTSTKLLWLWSNESLIFSTRRRVHLLFLSSGNDCSLTLIEFSWLWANNHDSFVSHMARINKIRL